MALHSPFAEALARLPDYLGSHVLVSLTALALGLGVSLPLAIYAVERKTLRSILLAVASILQTIPGLALLALGWWEMRGTSGWGALVSAAAALAFAEAGRLERSGMHDGELWLFSRRSAIVAAVPFALAGAWTSYIVAILVYAALSFFIVQHVRHHTSS